MKCEYFELVVLYHRSFASIVECCCLKQFPAASKPWAESVRGLWGCRSKHSHSIRQVRRRDLETAMATDDVPTILTFDAAVGADEQETQGEGSSEFYDAHEQQDRRLAAQMWACM